MMITTCLILWITLTSIACTLERERRLRGSPGRTARSDAVRLVVKVWLRRKLELRSNRGCAIVTHRVPNRWRSRMRCPRCVGATCPRRVTASPGATAAADGVSVTAA